MTIFKPLAAALSLILLAGCQSLGMRDQTIAYNEAVADSTNQFFLLNVLRARDRFPIYYTRTTGNSSGESASPGMTFALSNDHLSPTLTTNFSGSNTVSLQNLDDQKFVRGVLTPVSLAALESYIRQGWPQEELLMMFVKKIEIDVDLARSLAKQFDTQCSASKELTAYCETNRPDGAEAPSTTVLGLECLNGTDKTPNPRIAVGEQPAVFDNYPPDPKRVQCFQAMLRVLLGLGLAPVSASKFSVIAPKLDAVDLRGLSEAITAKLSISPLKDGTTYAICTKSDVAGFTLDKDRVPQEDVCLRFPEPHIGDAQQAATSNLSQTLGVAGITNYEASVGGDVHLPVSTDAAAHSISILSKSMPTSCATQVERNACLGRIGVYCDKEKARHAKNKSYQIDPVCSQPTLEFTTRSLDSMIYYLGEVVRAELAESPYWVQIWMHGPTQRMELQSLFVVDKGNWVGDAAVTISYRGANYGIRQPCPTDRCAEADRHRSLQVLSLLNQIWGLQKEASETPSVPVVSVINSR